MSDFEAFIRLSTLMGDRRSVIQHSLRQIEESPIAETLIQGALSLRDLEECKAFLAQSCHGTPGLRARVKNLLAELSLAIDDVNISSAVTFIHRNVHRPFKMKELLAVSSMPRRTFERRFVEKLGIDSSSFINRCRVERASGLLKGTKERPLSEVASLSGFKDLRQFRAVFHRLMGVPPAVYQRKNRGRKAGSREGGAAVNGKSAIVAAGPSAIDFEYAVSSNCARR